MQRGNQMLLRNRPLVGGFAFIEVVYYWCSVMAVKECIKINPTKHSEELLAAPPSLQQTK